MNAYEMAEILDMSGCGEEADMLRQQADRITELEKQLEDCKNPIMQAIALAFENPLTHEEINEIYLKYADTKFGWQLEFARAIEERHGIK
jgi:hypothetical protein